MRWLNKNNKENIVLNYSSHSRLRILSEWMIGCTTSITDIRILYPRGKNNEDLCVGDLFSVVLWHTLVKKGMSVKIDRGKGISNVSHNAIKNDIHRKNCLIIMVITRDGINKFNHYNFYNELKECNKAILEEDKSTDLFLPILLCSPDSIDEYGKKMYNNLIKINNLNRIEDFMGSSLNEGFIPFQKHIYRSIQRIISSI